MTRVHAVGNTPIISQSAISTDPVEQCVTPQVRRTISAPVQRTAPAQQVNNPYLDPEIGHDNCEVGMLVSLDSSQSHELLEKALYALEALEHRTGHDHRGVGDGAGVAMEIPRAHLARKLGINEIQSGEIGVGMFFLPQDPDRADECRELIREKFAERGFYDPVNVKVVTNPDAVAPDANPPQVEQFVVWKPEELSNQQFERVLYEIEQELVAANRNPDFNVCSLSSQGIVYKGMVRPSELRHFYPELNDSDMETSWIMDHGRYSTNTTPRWGFAHPFSSFNCHNGEINTLRGCQVHADTVTLRAIAQGTSPEQAQILHGGSDSQQWGQNFRHSILVGGRSPELVVSRMMPPSRSDSARKGAERLKVHDYLALEGPAWQGPALMVWMGDGKIGVTLDSCGLRPASYMEGLDSRGKRFIYIGSQPLFEGEQVEFRGDIEPGQTFMVNLNERTQSGERKLFSPDAFDDEVVVQAEKHFPEIPIRQIPDDKDLPEMLAAAEPASEDRMSPPQILVSAGIINDYMSDVEAMAETGNEVVASMGEDIVPWVMSDRPAQFNDAFRQLFAEVTNPPLDSIRSADRFDAVMNFAPDHSPLEPWGEKAPPILQTAKPVLTEKQSDWLCNESGLPSVTLHAVFSVEGRKDACLNATLALCDQVEKYVKGEIDGEEKCLVRLTHKGVDHKNVAIPMVAAVGAINKRLKQIGKRLEVKILVESPEFYDTHTAALAFGYGASGIVPYAVLNALTDRYGEYARKAEKKKAEGKIDNVLTLQEYKNNYRFGLVKGVIKIMSKMGVCSLSSYAGAQVFSAPGVSNKVLDIIGPGTSNPLAGKMGVDWDDIQDNAIRLHARGRTWNSRVLPGDNEFKAKVNDKVPHQWSRPFVDALHEAIESKIEEIRDGHHRTALRIVEAHPPSKPGDLLRIVRQEKAADGEPLQSISQKRFRGQQISYGSISELAHRHLAKQLNELGIPNGSGEGGIHGDRFGGDDGNAIVQVAAGRFGVTSRYLNGKQVIEIEIKMAQGAKPGEGGQLPGHKNTPDVAAVRNATPGTSLISPPPQHDIYSIEDLATLIRTLKANNPAATVGVKLVGQPGIETIAFGCVKAGADTLVLCSGAGGTGATPRSSKRRAGDDWETAVAKTHQLLLNAGVRDQVHIVADGGIKAGRDVIKALLLGADSVGLGTYLLVAGLHCIKCDQCHMDTCPEGIATQRKDLIEKLEAWLKENPDSVKIAVELLAKDVQEILVNEFGGLTTGEIIGRTDFLARVEPTGNSRADKLDLSEILVLPTIKKGQGNLRRNSIRDIDVELDKEIVNRMGALLTRGNGKRNFTVTIRPSDVTGPYVAGAITRQLQKIENFDANGLMGDGLSVDFIGNAGPNFGALGVPGMKWRLKGAAPDGFGAMNNGAFLIAQPPDTAKYASKRHTIIHNAALYGMTKGLVLIRGRAGTRFAVRFSGGAATVAGFGPEGAQYMTGGAIGVYGSVGHNLGAGMTGGVLFVYSPEGREALAKKCSKDVTVGPMGEEEIRFFKELTRLYSNETESPEAKMLLDNPNEMENVFAVYPATGRTSPLPDLKATIAAERTPRANVRRVLERSESEEKSGTKKASGILLTRENAHRALMGRPLRQQRRTFKITDPPHHDFGRPDFRKRKPY